MNGFAYTSYKHHHDQALLDRLSNAIYLLKIQAQGQLEHYGIPISAVQDARADLAELLVTLQRSVHLLVESRGEEEMSLAFTGVATRFLQVNPGDVFDRLAELERVDQRLHDVAELPERDFRWLDNLQLLLEAEAAEGVHGLYRL